MPLWKDGMENKNMIDLDNHTNFTVSPKHMKQQSYHQSLFFYLSCLKETWPHPFLVTSARQSLASQVTFSQTHHYHHTEYSFETKTWLGNTGSLDGQNRKAVYLAEGTTWIWKKKGQRNIFCELTTSHRPLNVSNFNPQFRLWTF